MLTSPQPDFGFVPPAFPGQLRPALKDERESPHAITLKRNPLFLLCAQRTAMGGLFQQGAASGTKPQDGLPSTSPQ